jgi:hypothetical protein
MDIVKVDKIIQYALAAASHEDFRNRELGPIHLIKYVYLADLAYAERNNGQTYTGVRWRFHNFGPWTTEVYNRLGPACLHIGATKKTIPTKFTDDMIRWQASDGELCRALEKELSSVVTIAIKRAVHNYGSDTAGLLHFVYLTKPMLNAAPGEYLDFSAAVPPATTELEEKVEQLSVKAQKRRNAELANARASIQQKLAQKREAICARHFIRQPRYDDVYFAGQKWLDSLAGPEIKEVTGEVTFSPDLWKSHARFDPES